jgi:hypothetical protein
LLSEPLLPWLVLGFLGVVILLRVARPSVDPGELRVRATIRRRLKGREYSSLHDLMLPTLDGTTQIDHVIVSRFGLFVIETKDLTGWIFGGERSRRWTQVIFGKRYRFQNPLQQNYKHLKAVEKTPEGRRKSSRPGVQMPSFRGGVCWPQRIQNDDATQRPRAAKTHLLHQVQNRRPSLRCTGRRSDPGSTPFSRTVELRY